MFPSATGGARPDHDIANGIGQHPTTLLRTALLSGDVKLDTQAQIQAFYRLVRSSTALAAHLTSLYLDEEFEDGESDKDCNMDTAPNTSSAVATPAPTYVYESTWPLLTSLRTLIIERSPNSLAALLQVAAAGMVLPTVKSLRIFWSVDAVPGVAYQLDNVWYRRLFHLLPALEQLDSALTVDLQDEPLHCSHAPLGVLSPRLRGLYLRYYNPADSVVVARLANALPWLQHLELREHEDAAALGAPTIPQLGLTELRSLSFRAGGDSDYGLHSPFDLRHLPRLQHVELGLGRCAPSLNLLLPQSVEVLRIADHTDFPVATLRRYLDAGSNRFQPSLRRLELDILDYNDYGGCGRQFNLKQSVSRRNPDATFRLHKNWHQPARSSNILYEELISLLEMAATRGVVVSGGVLRAINIQQSYDNQLDIIAAPKTRTVAGYGHDDADLASSQSGDRAGTSCDVTGEIAFLPGTASYLTPVCGELIR